MAAEPPVALRARAEENLHFIRTTMERAGSFTAVPGRGGVVMGLSAIVATVIAHGRPFSQWIAIWLGEAVVAFVIAAVAIAMKSKRANLPVFGQAGRRFWIGFSGPALAGAVLTVALAQANQWHLLPATWLLLYGAAVIAGGGNSVRIVPLMGACFMALGLCAVWTPASYHDWLLGAGFGALQIVFGIRIARKHGG